MKTVEREKTTAFSKYTFAQLVAGYSEELAMYQMLLGLTARQRRCLSPGGSLVEYIGLLDQDDIVLSQIERLESELAPLHATWVSAPPAEHERAAMYIRPLLDEIAHTIQKSISLKQDSEQVLDVRCRNLSQKLTELRVRHLPSAEAMQQSLYESVATMQLSVWPETEAKETSICRRNTAKNGSNGVLPGIHQERESFAGNGLELRLNAT